MVSQPLKQSDTRAEGLRGLLLCPAGTRCPDGSSRESQPSEQPSILDALVSMSVIDPMISKELESARLELSRFEPVQQANHHQDQVQKALESAINVAEQTVADSRPGSRSKCFLLEVYANDHSPLTEAVRAKGLISYRFTRSHGDLATFTGRRRLWQMIDDLQPEHIFVAPECGPWGGWNRLNSQKSLQLWDKIHNNQEHEKQHVRLCATLCKYQVSRNRHFHLEQPNGSGMTYIPEFVPIAKMTQQAVFDMCSFGLKIPKTHKFIKKRSQVWTSSQQVFEALNHHDCKKEHEHQLIAGSVSIAGKTTRLSRFCATYCRGFSMAIASALQKTPSSESALVASDSEHVAKRPRLHPGIAKRRRIDDGPNLSSAPAEPGASSSSRHWFPMNPCGMKPFA